MKQRFSISRDTGGEKIVIKEYAELDKGVYSLLCEESYAVAALEAALAEGADSVAALLRSESFFPPSYFAKKLIATLEDYFQQGNGEPVKIEADDAECIKKAAQDLPEGDNGSLDDLLDVEEDEVIEDEQPIGKLDAPIKIAEVETQAVGKSL